MSERRRWSWRARLARGLLFAALLALLLPALPVALFAVVDPPVSAFMLAERLAMWTDREPWVPLRHDWVDFDDIAPAARLAVVAAEDQKFPQHAGFDLESIEKALDTWRGGGRLRGASTISQQVARNLFLWRQRSFFRKGVEAYLTLLVELAWSKRRILEVYLNVAEMGHGIYGVQAAAREHFGRTAATLTAQQAALLAAVLPDPRDRDAGNPSAYVRERAAWIRGQMRNLGEGHLAGL